MDKLTKQLAGLILEAAHSDEGTDVVMINTAHLLVGLIREVELQAQRQPGYHVGWLELVSDYCADRLNPK